MSIKVNTHTNALGGKFNNSCRVEPPKESRPKNLHDGSCTTDTPSKRTGRSASKSYNTKTEFDREALAGKRSRHLQSQSLLKDPDNVPHSNHGPLKLPVVNRHQPNPDVVVTDPPISCSSYPISQKHPVGVSTDGNDIAVPKQGRSDTPSTCNTKKSSFGIEQTTGGLRNKFRAKSTCSLPISRDIRSHAGDLNSLAPPANATVINRRSSLADLSYEEPIPAPTTKEFVPPHQRSLSFASSSDSDLQSDDSVNGFKTPGAGVEVILDTPRSKKKSITPSNIDDKIHKYIETKLIGNKVKDFRKGTKGQIYINKNHQNQPGQVYKIGKTKMPTDERRKKQENKCGDSTEECDTSGHVLLYHSAEYLCHLQLQFFRRPYNHPPGSKCSQTHQEYFEVEEEIAKAVVGMWTAFCEHVPYNPDGELKTFWANRLSNMENFPMHQTHHDHAAQIRRWRSFVDLSFWDAIRHDISEASCYLFRLKHDMYFWEFTCLILVLIGAFDTLFLGQIGGLFTRIIAPLGLVFLYFFYTLPSRLKCSSWVVARWKYVFVVLALMGAGGFILMQRVTLSVRVILPLCFASVCSLYILLPKGKASRISITCSWAMEKLWMVGLSIWTACAISGKATRKPRPKGVLSRI